MKIVAIAIIVGYVTIWFIYWKMTQRFAHLWYLRYAILFVSGNHLFGLVWSIKEGNVLAALIHAAMSALWVWLFLNNWPPKKRKKKRGLLRVAIMDGRLKVVPVKSRT